MALTTFEVVSEKDDLLHAIFLRLKFVCGFPAVFVSEIAPPCLNTSANVRGIYYIFVKYNLRLMKLQGKLAVAWRYITRQRPRF